MVAVWQGSGPLRRGDDRIQPGEEFEPTDAERRSFGDLIGDSVDESPDEDGGDEPELPGPPFDPSEYSVAELREELEASDYSEAELAALEAAEHEAEGRTTALEAITGIR